MDAAGMDTVIVEALKGGPHEAHKQGRPDVVAGHALVPCSCNQQLSIAIPVPVPASVPQEEPPDRREEAPARRRVTVRDGGE